MAITTTYTTLAALRTRIGVATGDTDYLEQLIDASALLVDQTCNTTFIDTDVTEEHSGHGSRYLKLRHRPVLAVASVTLASGLLAATEYELLHTGALKLVEVLPGDNPRVWRGDYYGKDPIGWPVGDNNISVAYSYGYSAVPVPVSLATLLLAMHLYQQNRSLGVSSESMGPRSVSYDKSSVPSQVYSLLARYIEPEVMG